MRTKTLKHKQKTLNITYRDDSDTSVIDEFFADKMYRGADQLIANNEDPILDIGAHIGMFSLYASILNPNIKIIALEPEPENYKLLKENLKQNHCKNVITKQVALVPHNVIPSEAEGSLSSNNTNTVKLYLSQDSHTHSTVSKSENPTEVPATTLEKLITQNKLDKIGLIKLDIEGAEFEIIRNMEHGTWSKIQYLVVEYHESEDNKRIDLENIIRSHGLSVEHFPNHFDKRFGLLICRNKKTD